MNLEKYFEKYALNISGHDAVIKTPYGTKKLIYADWTASGREYSPIEHLLVNKIGPYIGNTHTETSFTGSVMTKAYAKAKKTIKDHVHANEDDVLLFCGSGMTGAIKQASTNARNTLPRAGKIIYSQKKSTSAIFIRYTCA